MVQCTLRYAVVTLPISKEIRHIADFSPPVGIKAYLMPDHLADFKPWFIDSMVPLRGTITLASFLRWWRSRSLKVPLPIPFQPVRGPTPVAITAGILLPPETPITALRLDLCRRLPSPGVVQTSHDGVALLEN
jgi:hypothetical protein